MSPQTSEDQAAEALHPRATSVLFGHVQAEQKLLTAYRGGRVPHAFLLVGPKGIGKATLAYRMARFVLAHPDPAAPQMAAATSLAVDASHPVARRVAAQAQGDLLVLERMPNEKGGILRQQIAVDDVRRTVSFFGSTAGEGGWRIAIVDAVDELNRSSANALLKVLEEPPERALLLLISHSASRVPATLRSRCRIITLRPLDTGEVAKAVATATGAEATDPAIVGAAATAEGSVARALALLDEDALALREQALALLDRLPKLDPNALHALGDALAGTDPAPLAAFVDTVNDWLSRGLDREGKGQGNGNRARGNGEIGRMARLAEAWERVNASARDAEVYNLERKPFVFSVFGLLAEATRG
jgi:DNA polymerase III subunit delta'